MRTPRLPRSPILLAALACTLLPHPGRASLLLALDTPAMVERADAIAIVDVASARAAWDDRHERIVSTIDLMVVESWKGAASPGTRIRVVQPGGTVGDLSLVVFGMARFSQGERALVFLRGPADRARVVGMAQGKRVLRPGAVPGSFVVAAPERAGASFVGGGAVAAARPLDEVRAQIRDLVLRGGAR
jgi:hypothetical protein